MLGVFQSGASARKRVKMIQIKSLYLCKRIASSNVYVIFRVPIFVMIHGKFLLTMSTTKASINLFKAYIMFIEIHMLKITFENLQLL